MMSLHMALLVVDVQNDFCPGGALGIQGGDEIIPVINKYIDIFSYADVPVILSRDWHPKTTKHFKQFGGTWPEHCVQGTKGARFHSELTIPDDALIVSKGMNPFEDSYSAFQASDENGVDLPTVLKILNIESLFIAGLATDYCVRYTSLDALKHNLHIYVLTDAVKGVDLKQGDSAKALRELQNAGALTMTFDNVSEMLSQKLPCACDHIGIFTNRIDALADFYENTLGFNRQKEYAVPADTMENIFAVSSDCLVVSLVHGKVIVELFQPTNVTFSMRTQSTTGFNHWGWDVGDKTQFIRRMNMKNVPVFSIDRGNHTVYFIADPDGNLIEIRGY